MTLQMIMDDAHFLNQITLWLNFPLVDIEVLEPPGGKLIFEKYNFISAGDLKAHTYLICSIYTFSSG